METSPSVCGNESRTTTTPATRRPTRSRTSAPTAYDVHRPHRGHERKPPLQGSDVPEGEASVGEVGASDTAAIVPPGHGPPDDGTRGVCGSLRNVTSRRILGSR